MRRGILLCVLVFLCLLWYNDLNVSAVHMICVKLFCWLEYLIQDISYLR